MVPVHGLPRHHFSIQISHAREVARIIGAARAVDVGANLTSDKPRYGKQTERHRFMMLTS